MFDPELGINIVDLGLVYDVDLHDSGDVDIQLQPDHDGVPDRAADRGPDAAFLAPIDGVGEVRPEMVLRPAWSPEMMSDEAKAALGIF